MHWINTINITTSFKDFQFKRTNNSIYLNTPFSILISVKDKEISYNASSVTSLPLVDPCTLAETLYEPYARTGNCEYNGVYAPCDRYIVPGWYKSDDLVLDQCPSLNSCGAVYPIWMNGQSNDVILAVYID